MHMASVQGGDQRPRNSFIGIMAKRHWRIMPLALPMGKREESAGIVTGVEQGKAEER